VQLEASKLRLRFAIAARCRLVGQLAIHLPLEDRTIGPITTFPMATLLPDDPTSRHLARIGDDLPEMLEEYACIVRVASDSGSLAHRALS
jgi:hypothetical protein